MGSVKGARRRMEEEKKPDKSTDKPDRLLVTRAILEEVKRSLGYPARYPDEPMLARMRQMIGRSIELVEELPEDDDEEIVVICALEPAVPGSLVDRCSQCGVTIYHSRNAPPNARKICTRCGPRLGQ